MAKWVASLAKDEPSGLRPCCEDPRVAAGARFCCACGQPVPVKPIPLKKAPDPRADKDISKSRSKMKAKKPKLRGAVDLDGNTIMLKFLVFLCGLAAFARTEAVLLQTQYFALCRGYGPQFFYAISAALLFVPGPMVIAFVKMIETGSTVPIKDRAFRKVVIANVSTSVALLFLILEIVLYADPAARHKLAYLYMPILGIGASLHFQAMSQALSFFPPMYMSILLVGCYCPFLIYVPVNSVGPLCSAQLNKGDPHCVSSNATAGSGNAAVQDSCVIWETDWTSVWSFYASAIVLCLQSIVSMWIFCKHPVAKHYLALADGDTGAAGSSRGEETEKLLDGEDPEESRGFLPVGKAGSVNEVDEGQPMHPSLPNRLRKVMPQLYSTVMVTIASQLVTSQYGMVPVQGHFMYLTTYLMYEFYICSCLGALLAMAMPLNSTVSVFLATARLVVVPLTFCYESMPGVPASTIPRSNVVALAVNFFFIVSGAWVFTSTFSVLQTKLADYPEDKKWALNLNNGIYFLAMIVALGISIAIGFFVWGTQ